MIARFITWVRSHFSQIRIIEDRPQPLILMLQSCQRGIARCLEQWSLRKHEGICFLLGRSDGRTTVCLLAVKCDAHTTRGSFHVAASEMAKIVSLATDLRLQIVGQVHTHPELAFHSQGDEEGVNIRYEGFVSIVVPNYGTDLPDLTGSAVYFFTSRWQELPVAAIRYLPSEVSV